MCGNGKGETDAEVAWFEAVPFHPAGSRRSARRVSPSETAHAAEPHWRALSPVARGLIAVRAVRSVGQGLLVVDFVLYLHAVGWSAAAIGALLSASGLVGAALILFVGVLSDRMGRRPFIVAYQILLIVGTASILLDRSTWVVVVAACLLGFGRGANGAAGPFGPAEQAWLARHTYGPWRGWTFSANNAASFVGMGVGALAAGAVAALTPHMAVVARYDVVFALTLATGAVNLVQVLALPERGEGAEDAPPSSGGDHVPPPPSLPRKEQNRALTLVLLINAVNSLGIGIVGPLIPYWFAVRFHAGPDTIGPVYGITFLLTAAASLGTGVWAARRGLIASIIWPRLIGVAAMVALAIAPTYALASGIYILRSMANRGSAGARQAFSIGLVDNDRRGLAASLTGLSMRLPSALGTALGGLMFAAGSFTAPFILAAGMQLLFVVLYGTVLGRYQNA